MPKAARACQPDFIEPLGVAATRFPRKLRLLKAADFQRVFKQSRFKSSDRFLTILVLSNDLRCPRLGMAISIKNSGNAVYRNRLKRLVRESFRAHQLQLGAQDFVVMTRSGIRARTRQQISSALTEHWQNIINQCEK